MILKQAELDEIPAALRISDWKGVDRNVDSLGVFSPIRDYSPLLEFPNLRCLLVGEANPKQFDIICRLTKLEKLAIDWTRSISSLAPLANLKDLQILALKGNLKEVDLEPLRQLTQLSVLSIAALFSTAANGGSIYCKSFAPLASLHHLEYLGLMAIKSREGGLEPLASLKALKELKIINIYSLEEYAYLSAALPDTKGIFHTPYYQMSADYFQCKKCGKSDFFVLFGKKRGARICQTCDRDKLNQHLAQFEQLKRRFSSAG